MKSAALGAFIVALGISTGSVLAPQAASALTFNFSFGGVTGLITGLAEGLNPCDSGSGCVVSVIDAGISGAPTGPYGYEAGSGFNVTGGSVLAGDWVGGQSSVPGSSFLVLQSFGASSLFAFQFSPVGIPLVEFGEVSFTSAPSSSAVPGPLPVLGAAAAFGYSRKLRKRIKGSSNTSSTAPFA